MNGHTHIAAVICYRLEASCNSLAIFVLRSEFSVRGAMTHQQTH